MGWQQSSGWRTHGWRGAAAAAGGGSLAVDSSVHATSNTTSNALTLSTSGTNRVIIVSAATNGGPVTGVSDTAGLTWTKAGDTMSLGASGSQDLELWWAPAAAQLSSDVITVSYTSGVFNSATALAVSGATSISSPFDGAAAVKWGFASDDPNSITTTAASTLVVGTFRFGSTASPTAGSGFTLVSGADFAMTEYQILSSAQTLSVTVGTGVGDSNGGIAIAVK